MQSQKFKLSLHLDQDFWSSEVGVKMRLEMLSQYVVWRTINNALQIYGSEAGAKFFKWISEVDYKICSYCYEQNGRIYRRGQFMPSIPVHPHCRCFWDVGFTEPPS